MLNAEGKINEFMIENMMNWRHSEFSVYWGDYSEFSCDLISFVFWKKGKDISIQTDIYSLSTMSYWSAEFLTWKRSRQSRKPY